MKLIEFLSVIKHYTKCPKCNVPWKIGSNLSIRLFDDRLKMKCVCGFRQQVDKDNNQIKNDAPT